MLLVGTVFFQNCSADQFATEGNGVPYEGQIPGDGSGDINLGDGSLIDQDNEGEPLPATEANSGNLPPFDSVDSVCQPSNSNIVERIEFGSDNRGSGVRFFALAGDALVRDRQTSQTEIVFNQYLTSGEILDRITMSGNYVIVRYFDIDGAYLTEMILCN